MIAGHESDAAHFRADLDAAGLAVELQVFDDHDIVALGEECAVDVSNLADAIIEVGFPLVTTRRALESIGGTSGSGIVQIGQSGASDTGTVYHVNCFAQDTYDTMRKMPPARLST